MTSYREFHRRSIEQRDVFWADEAKLVDWHKPFERVLDYDRPPFARWFVGGETNLCHNAIDRHLDKAQATSPRWSTSRPKRASRRLTPTGSCTAK